MLELFNTLTRQKKRFEPIEPGKVRLYTCGPTVYNYAHIGNLRTYIFEGLLRRTLEAFGYQVNHVMNVTDVGHLESDADEGEDKLELAARKQKRSPWEIARFYEDAFFADHDALNLPRPTVAPRAPEHIGDMIAFVKTLLDEGYAYEVEGNVYFSVEKFPGYGQMANIDLAHDDHAGARVEADQRKRHPRDFVLWFSQSKFPNQIMQWDSPWGRGFPGWHIECSVLSSKYLGERIDIHCGGIDHIPVHHTNEIAQSEACFGHKWVNYWLHGEFLVLDKGKMAKSAGNFITLRTLTERGYKPEHYLYLCLGAHYRTPLTFNFEALDAARNGFERLRNRVIELKVNPAKGTGDIQPYKDRFWAAIADDLNAPQALAVLWDVLRNQQLGSKARLEALSEFDRVFGFGIDAFSHPEIPEQARRLVDQRAEARTARDFTTADALRDRLRTDFKLQIKDTPQGTEWYYLESAE